MNGRPFLPEVSAGATASAAAPRRMHVVESLRQAIVSGELPDGYRLVEARIAQDLDTSRAPVREALRQLESEGLVATHPYRGAVVIGVSDQEVVEILIPIRLTIERFAFRQALERLTDDDYADLARQVWVMRDAARSDDVSRSVEADIRFHELVLASARQPQSAQIWRGILPRIRAYFFRHGLTSDLRQIAVEHDELLRALQTRDETVVMPLLQRHIAERTRPPRRSGKPARNR